MAAARDLGRTSGTWDTLIRAPFCHNETTAQLMPDLQRTHSDSFNQAIGRIGTRAQSGGSPSTKATTVKSYKTMNALHLFCLHWLPFTER